MLSNRYNNTPTYFDLFRIAVCVFLISIVSLSASASEDNIIKPLPRVDNAQVFAEFTDRYPVVLNYFTSMSEKEVINFYQKEYGKISHQSLKRGRLTLYFAQNDKSIRVVISQQNNKRQVDVLSEEISIKDKSN